jgi:hypothetical protein
MNFAHNCHVRTLLVGGDCCPKTGVAGTNHDNVVFMYTKSKPRTGASRLAWLSVQMGQIGINGSLNELFRQG